MKLNNFITHKWNMKERIFLRSLVKQSHDLMCGGCVEMLTECLFLSTLSFMSLLQSKINTYSFITLFLMEMITYF